jgi:hypothetical protein
MVFEKTACKRAGDFLNNTLAGEQFGFRKNLSTNAVLHEKCYMLLIIIWMLVEYFVFLLKH